MIYDQETMPLPRIRDARPTFRQFRQYYGLSREEVAHLAQTHILFIERIENGVRAELSILVRVFEALSRHIGREVRIGEMRGIRIRNILLLDDYEIVPPHYSKTGR